MSDIYNQVLESWNAAQVSLVRPLDYKATAERFRAAGLNPAEDFTKLYSIVGGMTDYETDLDLWSCWSIDKIISEIAEYPREGIPFGDWSIHSHLHVARAESAVRSSVWVDGFSEVEPVKVADSLEDFLDRYLRKDETILIFFDQPSIRNRTTEQIADGNPH
jgi:hypothetical protein